MRNGGDDISHRFALLRYGDRTLRSLSASVRGSLWSKTTDHRHSKQTLIFLQGSAHRFSINAKDAPARQRNLPLKTVTSVACGFLAGCSFESPTNNKKGLAPAAWQLLHAGKAIFQRDYHSYERFTEYRKSWLYAENTMKKGPQFLFNIHRIEHW